jgi:hypothetical protein
MGRAIGIVLVAGTPGREVIGKQIDLANQQRGNQVQDKFALQFQVCDSVYISALTIL